MTHKQKQTLADIYNTLSSLIPIPSEDFSTKHAECLRQIRLMLEEENAQNNS